MGRKPLNRENMDERTRIRLDRQLITAKEYYLKNKEKVLKKSAELNLVRSEEMRKNALTGKEEENTGKHGPARNIRLSEKQNKIKLKIFIIL